MQNKPTKGKPEYANVMAITDDNKDEKNCITASSLNIRLRCIIAISQPPKPIKKVNIAAKYNDNSRFSKPL